jgi:hypothetical protein
MNARGREQALPVNDGVAEMDLTATGVVGDPPSAARARADAIRSGARGGEDGRPGSTASWRRRAHLGRRSEGGPGAVSLGPDARPTLGSFADEALFGSLASDRPSSPPSGTGVAGVVFLVIHRLALLCVALGKGRRGSSSGAVIPTRSGAGMPAPGHAPIAPVLALTGFHAAEGAEGAS